MTSKKKIKHVKNINKEWNKLSTKVSKIKNIINSNLLDIEEFKEYYNDIKSIENDILKFKNIFNNQNKKYSKK